jgi:hypothetical protein
MPIFQHNVNAIPTPYKLYYEGDYGGANVDAEGGGSIVNGNGELSLYGNSWVAFKLDTPYSTSGNTRISFNFELVNEAEGHAICVEEDLDEDTFGGFHKRCIALAGTQYDTWNDNHVKKIERAEPGNREEDGPGRIMSETVVIGDLFPESNTLIRYIAFVQDNDAAPYEGVSRFWDIELFEVPPVSSE